MLPVIVVDEPRRMGDCLFQQLPQIAALALKEVFVA